MSTAELERFLSEIEAQLADLPAARRAEIVAEARNHLEAMLAANRADGLDETAAWQKTRRDFGDADEIGRDLEREWKRAPRVETEGKPLSRREKLWLFARPVAVAIIFYFVCSMLMDDKRLTIQWQNGLLAFFAFGCMGFGLWRWRRRGGKWTPASIFSYAVFFVVILQSTLHLIFNSQIENTVWETIYRNSSSAMLPLLIIASIWLKREAKTTLPWRQMPQYAKNPIAAEETYRLSPKIGLAIGVTFSCIGSLTMVQFFGLTHVIVMDVIYISVAYLYGRFLMSR